MLLRISTLATGRTGVRPETSAGLRRPAERGPHPGGARVRQPRLLRRPRPAGGLRAGVDRRGRRPGRPRACSRPAAEALAAAGLAPVALAEKEGLALINGTDGMLGMLVLALADLRRLVTTADITAAMSMEGLLGSDAVFAPDLQRPAAAAGSGPVGGQPRRGDGGQPDPGEPSHRRPAPGCRTPTRCAAPRRSPARPGTDRLRHHRGRARAGLGHRQPRGHPRRSGRVQRQLPRRADRVRARLPGHRGRRPGQHRRAPHRPLPGPGPQQRAAGLPRRRSRGRLRADDRPVHPGRDRGGAEAARRSPPRSTPSPARPCRRTTCRWAGPPAASCAGRSTG